MLKALIFLLFFGSGATALIYQVVWTKLLTLTFGVTLLAVSTVLTCFFGGLALGSFLGGRWVDAKGEGFKWYGAAEILIGVYAIIFPFLLYVNNSAYGAVVHGATMGFNSASLVKFVFSAFLLIVPTTLMGATLPILSRTLARSESRFALDIGGLYAVNTAGAIAGAVLTAFVLIPSLGLKTILYSVGVLNIAIGAAAIALGRSPLGRGGASGAAGVGAPEPSTTDRLPAGYTTLLVWCFAVSGFTGLAYEVVWTRVLGFILTGTVYAFAVVLAVFLAGIAAGSFVFSLFIDRFKSRTAVIALLAAVEAVIGLSSIALITLYDAMPSFDFYAVLDTTTDWGQYMYLNFLISFMTLILPTFLFGATFPLVCKLYESGTRAAGSRIGNIYSVNTVGGIAGSFAAGFLLIPLIGMQRTVVLTGLVNVAVGVLLMLLAPAASRRARYGFLAASAIAAVVVVAALPDNMPKSLHKSLLKGGEEMVFYREGAAATVMIAEKKGADLEGSNKRLWVNGNRATAAYYEGLQINRFQGVLPMVLHPDPREVLVICFGSGTTFGTLSTFPVDMVDNVEIASTVIEGAPYFKKENNDVLNNPKSRINIDDGRSFLAATTKKFDVITEEPMHPSLAGVANLYTKEYYELAKSRLKKGGIMSQWIPVYNLTVEDVKIMTKTFVSVFPHTTIWLANADIFLIGSESRQSVDYMRLKEKLAVPEVKRLLADIDLEDPAEFLGTFLMNEEAAAAYAAGFDVMTDDIPVVEFTGPKSQHANTISPNIAELFRYREPVWPHLVIGPGKEADQLAKVLERKYAAAKYNLIGRAYYADANYPEALKWFREAVAIDPDNRNSLHYLRRLRSFQGY